MHKNYVTLNTSELTAKIGNNASDPPLHNQIIKSSYNVPCAKFLHIKG